MPRPRSASATADQENAAPAAVKPLTGAAAPPARRARPRALAPDAAVDASGLAAAPAAPFVDPDADTEYERERAARIARNRAMLAALAVPEAAAAVARTARPPPAPRGPPRPRVDRPPRPAKRGATAAAPMPTRTSARRRGLAPEAGGDGPLPDDDTGGEAAGREELLTCEAYWEERGGNPCATPIVSDGSYRGWVAPDVCARFGIEASADAAWEAHGGGRFTFKIDKASIPAALKARGWSDARAFAATQLRKNPNAYFYRHVEPGGVQATGEWTAEEHDTFLATARAHGVGDKWGLFSSHLPQRVGYQCSAYYREVVLPRGEAVDGRFRMTRGGRAVYVGGGGGGGGGAAGAAE